MAKRQVTVNLDEETIAWIDEKIKDKKFATRSHGLEYAIDHLMKEERRKSEKEGNGDPVPAVA